MRLEFSIYRYNPDVDDAPRMQDYTTEADEGRDMMLLDALIQLKEKDPSLSFRRSCREGVRFRRSEHERQEWSGLYYPDFGTQPAGQEDCDSPAAGLPVIRDLVVDMGQFYAQYEKIKPYLLNNGQNPPAREHLQMPEQREKLDGLYECILCACCSTSCPSFWWNPDKFIGPAGLLAAYRFLIDSRDTETDSRLDGLSDAFSVFRCHSIMNCVSVCPKGLNPTRAIGHIKSMLLQRNA